MICEVCEGNGIVLARPQWQPEAWDGSERRKEPRDERSVENFNEVPAPLYKTCDNCEGLGRILPGLIRR